MRTIVGAAGLTGALLLAACSEPRKSVDESLKKDLELAFTSSPITLQESPKNSQVVSAIERAAPEVKKRPPSQRTVKYTPAPVARRAPVEVAQADESEEIEEVPVEAPVTTEEVAIIPSARPQPVNSPGVGTNEGVYDRGNRDAVGIGTVIGVVLRGGHAGVDDCDPRRDRRGRRGGHISINNRIPVIGTFPGSGRMTASLPRSGRVRF